MRPLCLMLRHVLVSGVMLFAAETALALPGPPTLPPGSATLNHTLSVTTGGDAIIGWSDFSIAAGDTKSFTQPTASSALLNRILSGGPTTIYGNLISNGGLVLINPAGFYIAAGAHLEASFLTLSTFNMSDADFLAGRSNFVGQGSTGSILIEGGVTISGDLSLYASYISLGGPVETPAGPVVLPPIPELNLVTLPLGTGDGILIGPGGSLTLSAGSGAITIPSAVPEPSVDAMLLAGLAALGVVARRRRTEESLAAS